MPQAANEIRISATNPHFAFLFIFFRLNGTGFYYKKSARNRALLYQKSLSFRIFGEPAFFYPFPLFKHFENGPEGREGGYSKHY